MRCVIELVAARYLIDIPIFTEKIKSKHSIRLFYLKTAREVEGLN